MKHKKAIAYTAVGAVLAAYAALHARLHLPEHERVFLNRLDRAVASGKKEIAINSLAIFDWDTVCITGPYGGSKTDQDEKLARYKRINSHPARLDDGVSFLEFVTLKSEEIRFISLPADNRALGKTNLPPSCKNQDTEDLTIHLEQISLVK